MTKMTRKAIKLVFNAAEPRCGDCQYWRPYDSGTKVHIDGSCRFMPPSWKLADDGEEIVGWPTLLAEEYACGQFKAAQ